MPSEEVPVVVSKQVTPVDIQRSVASLSPLLSRFISDLGLPVDGVLRSGNDRAVILEAMERMVSQIKDGDPAQSIYLSKFIVAISVGLFDAGLNYLWNEIINMIRSKIVGFDLSYFFSVSTSVNNRYKGLGSEDHLIDVTDKDLLEICRRMGLIGDITYQRLSHANFMRNHASAAHPNTESLSPYEMLSWLETFIKDIFNSDPNKPVLSIKRLMDNVRNKVIGAEDFDFICKEIESLNSDQSDDLCWTVFGMYTDSGLDARIRENIKGISKCIWNSSSQDRKHEIGSRLGFFRGNGDTDRRLLADEFLKLVGGESFKDEDSLAQELIDMLNSLKDAHFSSGNFYAERLHVRVIDKSVPDTGSIPRPARPLWVKVISMCFVGNGMGYLNGVDEMALPYYVKYIERFGEREIVDFIKIMSDVEFVSTLNREMNISRLRKLAGDMIGRSDNVSINELLEMINKSSSENITKLHTQSDFKRKIALLPRLQ